ncbi:hypothetical protein [Mucilaginibacter sp. 3215]|uniref:hypothetical protein n=1 Tax=Mucilaginibacter sp. 3215 TaxID=3373912 RepID=UPI003D1BCD36
MDKYKDKLGGLADKLKQERPKTPIQEVQPVKVIADIKVVEVQFNNWIPKTLLKRVKAFGLEYDISLKNINIQALELYLNLKAKPEINVKKAD